MSDVIELVNRNLSCTIVPELGGAITRMDLRHRGQVLPILAPTPAGTTDPRQFSLVHLAPVGSAVRKNQFRWEGKPKLLEPNLPDEPFFTNGVAWQRPWTGKKDGKFSATLRYTHKQAPGWPFDFSIAAVFDLEEDHLSITYELANESRQGITPVGFGSRLRVPKPKDVMLSAGVSSIWHTDPEGIPTIMGEVPYELDLKEGLDLGMLDTPERWFSGWVGKASLDYAGSRLSLMLKADDPLTHLGLSARRGDDFACLTALSHVPGVLDNKQHDEDETGYRVLGPGESLTGQVKLDVDPGLY